MNEFQSFTGSTLLPMRDAFEAIFEQAKADPAQADRAKSLMKSVGLWKLLDLPDAPTRSDGPPPVVDRTKVTLMQTAVFDNGEPSAKAKKSKKPVSRYGVAIEVWTVPSDEIKFGRACNSRHKFNIRLKDRRGLIEDIRTMKRDRRYPVDPAYLDELETMAQPGGHLDNPGALIGLLRTQVKADDPVYEAGNHFHPYQFILLDVRDGHASNGYLMLGSTEADVVRLGQFDDRDPSGAALFGGVIAQARTDLCGFSDSWRTN